MSTLALRSVRKEFAGVEVIRSVDLDVADGEFVVFVGPSGCGKSTLLRMLAGLEQLTEGTIAIDDRDVTGMLPLERGVAMVFQSYALYPHMSVADNIGFGLRIQGLPKKDRDAKVMEAARILQLEPLLQRKPRQLSGGQRQRVAIGRAIVKSPRIFLFDEPLSNLDAELRVQMRLEIARLHAQLGATMIYVTHDQVEAMTLADKIVVLRDGRIEQVGRPIELYENPANLFVAGFIGSPKMNVLEGRIVTVTANSLEITVPTLSTAPITVTRSTAAPAAVGDPVSIGFRPQHCILGEGGIPATVSVTEQLGNLSYLYVATKAGAQVTIEQQGLTVLRSGDAISFRPSPDRVMAFTAGGARH